MSFSWFLANPSLPSLLISCRQQLGGQKQVEELKKQLCHLLNDHLMV